VCSAFGKSLIIAKSCRGIGERAIPTISLLIPTRKIEIITISTLKEADDNEILVGKAADFVLFFNNLWTCFE
jgi:hypothetical protein